jgi:serine O-acetyltransferase
MRKKRPGGKHAAFHSRHRREGPNPELGRWMTVKLPGVVDRLERTIRAGFDFHTEDVLDFAGRNDVYVVLDELLAALFPGCFSKEKVQAGELNFYLHDLLRHISFKLGKHILEAFKYRCLKTCCDNCTCEGRAAQALVHLIESLPDIRGVLLGDIQAAYDGDPAAQSLDEIILSYPGIEAIAVYRIAHTLYELDVPILPRVMSERAHSRTGIDIHPGAKIGPRFFIDHGTGVVIGETTTIGSNVKIYQGVTIGALSPFDKNGKPRKGEKRHPDIGDDVIIYANATILGGGTVIGRGAVIGGNTWITRSVPAGARVYRDHTG